MDLSFEGPLWYWKGPAPWYFVTIPAEQGHELHAIAPMVTYGWGVVPVYVQIGATAWYTSLLPKDSSYLVPVKAQVRKAEQLEEGAIVTVRLEVRF